MNSRILLVEDEPGLVVTVSDLLGNEGYQVESAVDGESGLAKAATGKFDLVILDVMLPRKTGLEVCRDLRQSGNDTAMPYMAAKHMVKGNKLMVDQKRLQNAPKVPESQLQDTSNTSWQGKADSYWKRHGKMSD